MSMAMTMMMKLNEASRSKGNDDDNDNDGKEEDDGWLMDGWVVIPFLACTDGWVYYLSVSLIV